MTKLNEQKKIWYSYHAYLHSYSLLDEYLMEYFDDFIKNTKHLYEEFFFIRYWLGGPHIRLRLKSDEYFNKEEFKKIFQDSIDNYLSKFSRNIQLIDKRDFYTKEMLLGEKISHIFWKEHGTVEIDEYKPEYTRYGGNNLILSENMFCESSELAMILNKQKFYYRLVISIDLMFFTFKLFRRDIATISEEYSNLWSIYNVNGENWQIKNVVEERIIYINKKEEYLKKKYETYFQTLKKCPRNTWFSHIHMTNNRIGIYPEIEFWIAKYIRGKYMKKEENI